MEGFEWAGSICVVRSTKVKDWSSGVQVGWGGLDNLKVFWGWRLGRRLQGWADTVVLCSRRVLGS